MSKGSYVMCHDCHVYHLADIIKTVLFVIKIFNKLDKSHQLSLIFMVVSKILTPVKSWQTSYSDLPSSRRLGQGTRLLWGQQHSNSLQRSLLCQTGQKVTFLLLDWVARCRVSNATKAGLPGPGGQARAWDWLRTVRSLRARLQVWSVARSRPADWGLHGGGEASGAEIRGKTWCPPFV